MRGFIATGRLDNTIEGYEFADSNFSHDLFLPLLNVILSPRLIK
jgi:hypothetical protein